MNDLHSVLREKVDQCSGCGACASICPMNCIRMEDNSEGFFYPRIDDETCVHCKKCRLICPVLSIEKREKNSPLQSWAAIAVDTDIQTKSSSGGIFTLLAQEVIRAGGIVYGAAFSEDFHQVYHTCADKISEIAKLRTSKYLQSNLNGCFHIIKKRLDEQRTVLFSGTPCQISGLKAFLGHEYDQLVCVAIICHGVPSPKLWGMYLDYIIAQNHGRKINSVNFRNKEEGWKHFAIRLQEQGKTYYKDHTEDPYMRMFLRDYSLRESCYHCTAKEKDGDADIVIGDFWGIEEVLPCMDYQMGTSLVLIHTEKGRRVYEAISQDVLQSEVSFDKAIKYNKGYCTSVVRPKERDLFYKDLQEFSWHQMVRKYGSVPFKKNVRNKLKKIYRSIKLKAGIPLGETVRKPLRASEG